MLKQTPFKYALSVLFGVWSIGLMLLCLSIVWLGLYSANFLYPIWHDHAGVGQAIDKFGPKNYFKKGLENTSPEVRSELFLQINRAVHNGGEGLAKISFFDGQKRRLLLREPEVIHLQDVANLIDKVRAFAIVNAFVWLALTFWFILKLKVWPTFRGQVMSLLGVVIIASLVLLGFGFKAVFGQLHIWIFPKDNQWFFFYQESLMATLMYAPHIFAYIGATMAALAAIIFGVLQWGLAKRFKGS